MQKFIVACLVCMATLVGFCDEGKTKFDNSADGFSISVPSDWKEIPKNVLVNYSKTVSAMMTAAQKQDYEYGYQPASNPVWLTYPYILIQVKNLGRMPESALKNLTQADLDKGIKKAQKGLESIVSRSSLEAPIYDPKTHIMWMSGVMNVAGVGKVKLVGGSHLTEKGMINVFCYSEEKEFDSYADVFNDAINSVEIADALKYKPGIFDSLPGGSGVLGGVVRGAIIGGAVGLVIALVKKMSNRG